MLHSLEPKTIAHFDSISFDINTNDAPEFSFQKLYSDLTDSIQNKLPVFNVLFETIKMWFSGQIVLGSDDAERNDFLCKFLILFLGEAKSSGRLSLMEISEAFSYLIYSPPFVFENATWKKFMDLFPMFIKLGGKAKENLQELLLNTYLVSGVEVDETVENYIKKIPVDMFWGNFMGLLLSALIFDKQNTNKLFELGVWSKENPAPKEFIKNLFTKFLKLGADEGNAKDKYCFFGLTRILLNTKVGIFKYLLPIDAILSPFHSAIFPFGCLLPESYLEIFDLFGNGYTIDGERNWFSIFAGAIRCELKKKRPASATYIIRYLSHLIYSNPRFVLEFAGDCISAINETKNIDFSSPEVALLCSDLCELINIPTFNPEGKKEFFKIIYTNVINSPSNILFLMFISLFSKKGSLKPLFLDFLLMEISKETLLLFGFAVHVYPSFITESTIEHLINVVPKDLINYLALVLIEILGYCEAIRKDTRCMIIIHNFAKSLPDSSFKELLNLFITTPLQYQLSYNDILTILQTQNDYIKFKSLIISSDFTQENPIVVCRNKFFMTSYQFSPIIIKQTEQIPEHNEKKPFTASKDYPFTQYHYSESQTHKKDTFYLLSSLGLFNFSNKNKIFPLSNEMQKNIKEYEEKMGRKQFDIVLTRVTNKSKSLFSEILSSESFNTFCSLLGNYLKKPKTNTGIVPKYSVTFYDTLLYRFTYFSKYSFKKEFKKQFIDENSFALIIYNESKSQIAQDNSAFDKWEIVLSVSKIEKDVYSISILKFPDSIQLPFVSNIPKLVSGENLSNEIGFILYLYVSSNLEFLYFDKLEGNELFEPVEYDGIDLISNIFGKTNDEPI